MQRNGELGEKFAAEQLSRDGYDILERNYHTRYGEIDIIAQKGGILAFVEVKTRAKDFLARPCEAVNFSKQKKLITSAKIYLAERGTDKQPRFDVFEVITEAKDGFCVLSHNHMTNAFTL